MKNIKKRGWILLMADCSHLLISVRNTGSTGVPYYGAQKIYWNELLPYAGLSVPLNFSRGRWFTNLEVGSNISYHQEYFKGVYKDSIKNTSYFSLNPQLLFTHQLQAGRMQIYPSFAQSLLIKYNRAISNVSGNQFLASANLFFPGLTSTNSLVIERIHAAA